jgi:hypothetical protein
MDIGHEILKLRSIEQACADLRAKYEKQPNPRLAQMVEHLETEIAARKASEKRPGP